MPETLAAMVDPFAEDIVTDPRRVEYSVPGLNDAAVEAVTRRIEALRDSAAGKGTAPPPKALVVSAARAGAGKSHLVGRLFRALSGQATLVNIRPFVDPDSCWKSILMRMVQELNFPDRFAVPDAGGDSATQLELFAHVTLGRIVADYLEAEGRNAKAVEILRRPAQDLVKLKRDKKWRASLAKLFGDKKRIGDIEERLRRGGLNLQAPETWMKILYGYTYLDDPAAKQACLDWLQADPIDEDAAAALGLRAAVLPDAEQGAGMENALAKSRVLDLCQLAVFFRPFLICFDQTENYGRTPELARTLGTVIADLCNEAANQLTLMTVNLSPWEKRLRPYWEDADLDRLGPGMLLLEGIRPAQGRALAEHRLARFAIGPEEARRFWGDGQWLDGLFEQPEMPVRGFLHECSKRWHACLAQPPPEEVPSLAELFARYLDKVSAQPRRLVFDRDTLFWAVADLAAGLDGVEVDRVTSRRRTNVPRWRYGGRTFLFGLEAGNHWKTWLSFATYARSSQEAGEDRVSVCLRTPELPDIPKPAWKSAGDIRRAMETGLLLLRLDRHQMVTLYAAHDLYVDAVQGDIPYEPEAVKEFLRGRLTDFWQAILGWRGEPRGEAGEEDAGADAELRQQVAAIVRERLFLSLEDLMARLPAAKARQREDVLNACSAVPRIRVYTSPGMTVLQWQRAV